MIIDWQSEYESVIRTIGSATYGKERWFYQENGIWYDRQEGDYIDFNTLESRIYEAGEADEIGERKIGKWTKNGNTLKCPFCGAKGENIKDDYCFNFCPNCGAYMREDDET